MRRITDILRKRRLRHQVVGDGMLKVEAKVLPNARMGKSAARSIPRTASQILSPRWHLNQTSNIMRGLNVSSNSMYILPSI